MSPKQTNLRNEYEHVAHGMDRQVACIHTLTKQRIITCTNSLLFTVFCSQRIHGEFTVSQFVVFFLFFFCVSRQQKKHFYVTQQKLALFRTSVSFVFNTFPKLVNFAAQLTPWKKCSKKTNTFEPPGSCLEPYCVGLRRSSKPIANLRRSKKHITYNGFAIARQGGTIQGRKQIQVNLYKQGRHSYMTIPQGRSLRGSSY